VRFKNKMKKTRAVEISSRKGCVLCLVLGSDTHRVPCFDMCATDVEKEFFLVAFFTSACSFEMSSLFASIYVSPFAFP
jgi:hypothetical protein